MPWLGITGTNGKTTTTQMLESMLRAAGLRTAAVGNIGRPVMETVLDPDPYDVLAVELSSHQLHWSHALTMHSAVVLNLQPDHLEWHGGAEGYRDAKAKIYAGVQVACVYNVADPPPSGWSRTRRWWRVPGPSASPSAPRGCRCSEWSTTCWSTGRSSSSVATPRSSSPASSDVTPAAPHNVANALAAAALARAYGVPATAVRDGLRAVRLGAHKIETVAVRDGVTFVDDSKATNPHAADAALRAFDSVVWIAGGQAKGTTFDDLVITHRDPAAGSGAARRGPVAWSPTH